MNLMLLFICLWTTVTGAPACSQQLLFKSLEISCSTIPNNNDWKKINKSTTHVLITCANDQDNKTLDNNQLTDLPKLMFFSVRNCPLYELPKEYFQHLIYLENVVLDNLPLASLRNNLFKNSTNILEVSLIRLEHLNEVYPRFMENQIKLTKINIVESNVTTDQMKPVLISVYITIVDIYWRRNKQPLSFPVNYFRDFRLNNLILEHNGIDNTEFLVNVRTKRLSLKNNPILHGGSLKLPSSEDLESLNLAFTGLQGIFGEKTTAVMLPSVKELILSDNILEGIANNVDELLPLLEILDVRNNRLTTLPSTLHHMLSKNNGRVLVAENMLHCNCEMKWITLSHSSLASTILCHTMATVAGLESSNKTLTIVNSELGLICTLPQMQLELYEQFKNSRYSVKMEETGDKVYTVALDYDQFLNWRCIGTGDPAPRLKWISNGQTLKVTRPSLHRYTTRTVMKNLVVERDNQSLTYKCIGNNVAGQSIVQLRLVRVPDNYQAQLAKMVIGAKNDGNIYRLSATLLQLWHIFFYIWLH